MIGIPAVLLSVVLLAVHCVLALEFYQTAVIKGWPQKKYLVYSLLFGFFAYLLIIALPDRGGSYLPSVTSNDLPEL